MAGVTAIGVTHPAELAPSTALDNAAQCAACSLRSLVRRIKLRRARAPGQVHGSACGARKEARRGRAARATAVSAVLLRGSHRDGDRCAHALAGAEDAAVATAATPRGASTVGAAASVAGRRARSGGAATRCEGVLQLASRRARTCLASAAQCGAVGAPASCQRQKVLMLRFGLQPGAAYEAAYVAAKLSAMPATVYLRKRCCAAASLRAAEVAR